MLGGGAGRVRVVLNGHTRRRETPDARPWGAAHTWRSRPASARSAWSLSRYLPAALRRRSPSRRPGCSRARHARWPAALAGRSRLWRPAWAATRVARRWAAHSEALAPRRAHGIAPGARALAAGGPPLVGRAAACRRCVRRVPASYACAPLVCRLQMSRGLSGALL